jgi:hypothetical protein
MNKIINKHMKIEQLVGLFRSRLPIKKLLVYMVCGCVTQCAFGDNCRGVVSGGPNEVIKNHCKNNEGGICTKAKQDHTDDKCGTQRANSDCKLNGLGNTVLHFWYKSCNGSDCDADAPWQSIPDMPIWYVQYIAVPYNCGV